MATVLIKKMQTAICNSNNDVCTAVQMQHTFRDRNLNCFAIRASEQQLKRWRLNKSQQATPTSAWLMSICILLREREKQRNKRNTVADDVHYVNQM